MYRPRIVSLGRARPVRLLLPWPSAHACRTDHENHEHFERSMPSRTAIRLDEYGYSRMYVYNATHLRWQFIVTDGSHSPPEYDTIGDDVMLVQHHHGSFSARQTSALPKVVEASERM